MHMNLNSQQITTILLAIQAFITLLITLRAFRFYLRTRSNILLTLGLSMGVIAAGGITGIIDSPFLHDNPTYNTIWFRYIGQAVAYLFIFLASLPLLTVYSKALRTWHIIATILLLVLLGLTPILPQDQPPEIIGTLSAIRLVINLAIFFSFLTSFYRRQTRFSFLMSAAFFLNSIGLWIYTMKFFIPESLLYDYLADSIRIVGLIVLYVAFLIG
jgi:hypothetical protein